MAEVIPFGGGPWPDLDAMDQQQLRRELAEVREKLALLDFQEPEDMESEAYEVWGEAHEDLEDLQDEILDLLEESPAMQDPYDPGPLEP